MRGVCEVCRSDFVVSYIGVMQGWVSEVGTFLLSQSLSRKWPLAEKRFRCWSAECLLREQDGALNKQKHFQYGEERGGEGDKYEK